MATRLSVGKLPPALLRELLGGFELPGDVRLGPALGEDACAIDVPEGTLVAATDPITLTCAGLGAHAVIINANDVAVMGVVPRWFLAAVLLPVGTTDDAVRELFADMRDALAAIGASLVGGHTEVTAAVCQPVVVGQMLGIASRGKVVSTGGARPGDVVVQAGAAPVEAAAVLAAEVEGLSRVVDPALLAAAREAIVRPGISVVDAALRATELGATALHDPTEGGLSAGLNEIAEAAGVRIEIDAERILWFEAGLAVCRAAGADPWGALASGALLAAFPARRGAAAVAALEAAGTPARVIGEVVEGSGAGLASGEALRVFERDEVARVLGAV